MGYGENITKTYKLKVIWDAQNNSAEYANQPIKCTVSLAGEQVVK